MDNTHIILIGKQGSGKSSIANQLGFYGFERVVSYTTRPPRSGELSGRDYIFLNDMQFNEIAQNLVAVRSYDTIFGNWRYGVSLEDINADVPTVTILDPQGYLEVKDQIDNRFAIFLDPEDDVRINRVLTRGDDPVEVARREETDSESFRYFEKHFQDLCELRISQKRSIDNDIYRILKYIRAYNKGEVQYDGRPGM